MIQNVCTLNLNMNMNMNVIYISRMPSTKNVCMCIANVQISFSIRFFLFCSRFFPQKFCCRIHILANGFCFPLHFNVLWCQNSWMEIGLGFFFKFIKQKHSPFTFIGCADAAAKNTSVRVVFCLCYFYCMQTPLCTFIVHLLSIISMNGVRGVRAAAILFFCSNFISSFLHSSCVRFELRIDLWNNQRVCTLTNAHKSTQTHNNCRWW